MLFVDEVWCRMSNMYAVKVNWEVHDVYGKTDSVGDVDAEAYRQRRVLPSGA